MREVRSILAIVLFSGCSLAMPAAPQAYNLVIVNDFDAPVFWSIEQPSGEMTRFEADPCSSHSEPIEAGRRWEVESGATFAVSSEDVRLLDAPLTVIEVRFGPDGAADVLPPRPSAKFVDAPFEGMTCVRR